MQAFCIRAFAVITEVALWVVFIVDAIVGPQTTDAQAAAGHGPLYNNPGDALWFVGALFWIVPMILLCLDAEKIPLTPFQFLRRRNRRLHMASLDRIRGMERYLVNEGLLMPRDEHEASLASQRREP